MPNAGSMTAVLVIPVNQLDLPCLDLGLDLKVRSIRRASAPEIMVLAGDAPPAPKTRRASSRPLESIIYVVRARRVFSGASTCNSTANPAVDFIFVPPYVPQQDHATATKWLGRRSGARAGVAVAINSTSAGDKPDTVLWIDPVPVAIPRE